VANSPEMENRNSRRLRTLLVAAPVRGTSAAIKVVPVAGDVVAAPMDATADVID